MKSIAPIFLLVLCLGWLAPARGADLQRATNAVAVRFETKDVVSPPGKPAGAYMVGISPFLDAAVKDAVYRNLVRLVVEDLPLNARLEVYDAYNLGTIARVTIPGSAVFNSPKTRANQFAGAIGEIRKFLARENARPAGAKAGFEAAIRLPQFCDFLAQERPTAEGDARPRLLLIGSPLYQDARESSFSMVDGYFPSDGHLKASREQSVYGFNQGDGFSAAPVVCWAYFGDPWTSDLHREKVARFWTLYLERRGGRLASFSSDLTTVAGTFSSDTQGPGAAANGWAADSRQGKPEMLRAARSVKQVDWLTGEAPDSNPPPPREFVGPLKIGIRWKQDIDLDLYATPSRTSETLFFQHPRSSEGTYFKDQRSSPGREYEYIEFDSPVDVRQLRAYINYYEGSTPAGPVGEVRLEFQDRIYKGTFRITASEGNQGRSGPAQADFWAKIPVLEILGIHEAEVTSNQTPTFR